MLPPSITHDLPHVLSSAGGPDPAASAASTASLLEWSQTSPSYSPAGTSCRDCGFPQEDECVVVLGAKAVIQSCYDLMKYPDEE